MSAPAPRGEGRAAPLAAGAGLLMALAGAIAYLTFGGVAAAKNAGTLLMVAGCALVVAGLLGLLFKLATARSFEWFISWRYLRQEGGIPWTTLIIGGILLLGTVGCLIAASIVGRSGPEGLPLSPSSMQRLLQGVALGLGIGAYVVLFLALLLRSFSLFTSISIFGVFLGTCALVVVLSVMGGFEHDLRRKILGTTSHVVITKPKKMFTDYREVMERVARIKEVKAYAPFIDSEIMITSQSNLSGVLLKGIDPTRIGLVTDLPKYLKAEEGAGSLDYLLHPEKLAALPEARFRPLISSPLGLISEDEDEPSAPASQPAAGGVEEQIEAKDKAKGEAKVKDRLLPLPLGQRGREASPRPVYPGIIIGAELAKNLRLYIGDDVNMVAPLGGMSPAGPIPKSKPFRVAGIFYSGMYEYDTKFAYITIPAAQRFLGLDDEVMGIEIRVGALDHATRVAARLESELAGQGFVVRDWQEMNRNLFSALELEKLVMFIVLTFIILVASFSIITNLIMVVLEKTREISSLKTMGASHRSVLKIFLFAGIYIGTIGMLMGIFTGIGFCLFLASVGLPLDPEVYYIAELPVRMDVGDISLVALASVTLSFLATLYPSLMAARLRPVEGLRRYEG